MLSTILFYELLAQLQAGWNGLPDKPEETPQTTLDLLWGYAGAPQSGQPGKISSEMEQRLRELVEKRLSGAPLAYLTGRQMFMGIEFLSSPEAMIPRKETEILTRTAVDLAHMLSTDTDLVRVMDLCTGSGNIPLTVATMEPKCMVIGADLSEEAVQLAQRNAQHLGLADRARFYQGDLFAPFENGEFLGQMTMITCNPPYISSSQVKKLPEEILQYEPQLAFDGGPFGIKILTRLVREAPRFLKPGGWLCFEVGLGQGKAMKNLVDKNDQYHQTKAVVDEAGELRAIKTCLQLDHVKIR